MKIQVSLKAITGVAYHRLIIPHRILQRRFGLSVKYAQGHYSEHEPTDIAVFSGSLGIGQHFAEWKYSFDKNLKACRDAGSKIVLDIDDYWQIDSTNANNFAYWRMHQMTERIEMSIREADLITTPSPQIKREVERQFGKPVVLLRNGIDPEEKQFRPNKKESHLVRFGYLGSADHLPDVRILESAVRKLNAKKELRGRWQIVLCGFSLQYNAYDGTGQPITVADHSKVYPAYERMLTADYQVTNRIIGYSEYLQSYGRHPWAGDVPEHIMPYRRMWARDVNEYAPMYNEFDIALAPLNRSRFNDCKSELKMIEAGWMGCGVIASDVPVYRDAFTQDDAVFVNNNDWSTAMINAVRNPEQMREKAAYLRSAVLDRYDAEKQSPERMEAYKNLLT